MGNQQPKTSKRRLFPVFFCFKGDLPPDQMQIGWKDFLTKTCSQLSQICSWTSEISSIVRDSKSSDNKPFEKGLQIALNQIEPINENNFKKLVKILYKEVLSSQILETGILREFLDFNEIFSNNHPIYLAKLLKNDKNEKFLNETSGQENLNNIEIIIDILREICLYNICLKTLSMDFLNIENIIGNIKRKFITCFTNKFETEKQNLNEAYFEFKQFIRLILDTIFLYYGLYKKNKEENPGSEILNRKNIGFFIIFQMFTIEIYLIFIKLISNTVISQEKRINKLRESLKIVSFSEYEGEEGEEDSNNINLDHRNTAFFTNLNQNSPNDDEFYSIKNSEVNRADSMFSFGEKKSIFYDFISENNGSPLDKPDDNPKKITDFLITFNNIANHREPVGKLKIIYKTFLNIYNFINMNKKIDMIKNEKKFNDKNIHFNCVKIFIWIIINSDLDGLLTQCLFIENFCFSNALESIEGYFFIIFKLILYEILDIDTEKINNNENKIIAELITNIWKKISENNKKIAEFIFKIKEKMKENFKLFK